MQRQTIKNVFNYFITLSIITSTTGLLPIFKLNVVKATTLNQDTILINTVSSIKQQSLLAKKATGKSYDDENFSVWMPGVADLPQKGMLSSVEASTHTYYATVYQDIDFLNSYLPLPDGLISQTLERIVSAFSQEKDFQIISKKFIKKGDVRGIEFTAKDPQGYYSKTQIFLNGSRMYILMALTDQSNLGSEADNFFNSLSLY
jgi:hypothetical protein